MIHVIYATSGLLWECKVDGTASPINTEIAVYIVANIYIYIYAIFATFDLYEGGAARKKKGRKKKNWRKFSSIFVYAKFAMFDLY